MSSTPMDLDYVPRADKGGAGGTGAPPPSVGRRIVWAVLSLGLACGWFVLAFVAFLYVTFPYDEAQAFVAHQVEERTGWQASMDSLRPVLPDGVKVKGLRLYGTDADPAADKPFLTSESAAIEASLFGLLTGRTAWSLDARVWGGDLQLDVDQSAELNHLVIDADGLDLAQMNLAGETWRLAGTGKISVDADLSIAKEVRKSEGQGSLQLDGLVLKDSQVYGITLPEARFTQAGGKLKVDKGKLNFEEAKFVSDVVEADVEGYIMLNQNFRRSRISLKVKFKLRHDLDSLAKVAMKNANHRTDDGFYHYLATGTFENPRWREDRAAARREQFKARRNNRNEGDDDDNARPSPRGGGDDDAVSRRAEPMDDEARQKRMEELEKRREEARKRREERLARIREQRDKRGGADDDGEPPRSSPIRRRLDEDEPPQDEGPGIEEPPPADEGPGEEDYSQYPGWVE